MISLIPELCVCLIFVIVAEIFSWVISSNNDNGVPTIAFGTLMSELLC